MRRGIPQLRLIMLPLCFVQDLRGMVLEIRCLIMLPFCFVQDLRGVVLEIRRRTMLPLCFVQELRRVVLEIRLAYGPPQIALQRVRFRMVPAMISVTMLVIRLIRLLAVSIFPMMRKFTTQSTRLLRLRASVCLVLADLSHS